MAADCFVIEDSSCNLLPQQSSWNVVSQSRPLMASKICASPRTPFHGGYQLVQGRLPPLHTRAKTGGCWYTYQYHTHLSQQERTKNPSSFFPS